MRPTKKQRELLTYIDSFITEHGYSPSYREIMNGLRYNSVATVALHVGNLVKRGHLRKRDNSARSLEVVASLPTAAKAEPGQGGAWLVAQIEERMSVASPDVESLEILVAAAGVLELPEADDLRQRLANKAAQVK